jgi:hypothetical protein
MRAWLALALTLPLLSGCLNSLSPAPSQGVPASPFELRLPVHIVAVGFDNFDDAALQAGIKPLLPQFQWVRATTTGNQTPEPLQYQVDYQVHHAPAAFAQDLFAYAKTVSRDDQPDASLAAYDARGEGRVCAPSPVPTVPANPVTSSITPVPPTCKPIQRIDADAMEAWIAGHRAAYGLDFGHPGQTLFILDSYTKGYLDPRSYHQYEAKSPAQDTLMRTLRAWGGAHDFVFLDVGAGPNGYDSNPYGSFGPGAPDLTTLRDGPIWEYKGGMRAFYANLGRDVGDAVRMLWARDPIYPFEYAERYVLPFYIYIDPDAHANPQSPLYKVDPSDVPTHTDEAGIRKAFADLAPWANVTVQFHYVYLPDGDTGVAQALKDAKDRYGKNTVDFGIVKRYFREHWDHYAPDVPGAKVYPTFAFILDAPSTGLYAYSDGDEVGRSWGVFVNIADFLTCVVTTSKVPPGPCFTEDSFGGAGYWWAWWNAVLTHELGHSFGLTHTHDTPGRVSGELTYDLNWLWDSTASAMTYRHTLGAFDAFDKELLLRNHAARLALKVARSPEVLPAAAAEARRSLDLLSKGDYTGAFQAARSAAAQSEGLLNPVPGSRGPASAQAIDVPATLAPLGLQALPLGTVVDTTQAIPLVVSRDATAFELQVKEADAPTHSGWAAYLLITDSKGKVLGALFNNGYDIGVWEALDKCQGTCQAVLVPYGGAHSSYTVTFTPLYGHAPWPRA